MPNGSEALDFEAVLKTTDFKREIANLKQEIRGFVNTTTTETKKIDNAFSNIAKVAAGAFAFTQLSDLPSKIIQVRGEFQNLEIAFTTMLKSKSAADKLLGEITQFAAKTPFTLTDVANGAKQLLAYGSSVKTVVSEIRTLGDISAGVSAPIGDLIYLYGTLRTQGRAYSVDIRQFAARGIPIYEELAKVLKINSSEVNNFVEAGKVGFKEVEQAFKNMTTNGGIFEGLTEKTSKSLTGLLSNFKDAVDRAFNDLGKSQEGLIATGITTATSLVDNYQEVLDILTIVIATYGTYKAAMLTVAAAQTLINTSAAAQLYLGLAAGIGQVTTAHRLNAVAIAIETKAMAALNTVTAINPYVALVTVIVALSTAIWVLSDNTTVAEEALRKLSKVEEDYKNKKDDLIAKTNELTGIIRSETASRLSQLDAFTKLQSIYPTLLNSMDLDTYKKLEATKAQKELNKAVDDFQLTNLQKQFNSLNDNAAKIKSNIKSLTEAQGLSGNQGAGITQQIEKQKRAYEVTLIQIKQIKKQIEEQKQLQYDANTPIEQQITHYEEVKISIEKQRAVIEKAIESEKKMSITGETVKTIFDQIRLIELNKDLDSVVKKLEVLNRSGNQTLTPADGGDKSYWDNLKKTNEQLRDGLGYSKRGGVEWQNYTKAIAEADKKLEAWNKTSKKSTTAKPVFAKGSLGYYEEVVNKVNEDLKKISDTNSDQFIQLVAKRIEAESTVAEIRGKLEKKYAENSLKSFEEVIRKSEEQLSEVNPNDVAKIQELQSIKLNAEKQAENLRKQFTIRSFDEEIEYKKQQYELYNRWVEFEGQGAANANFSQLIKQGDSFKAYLEGQILALQAKIEAGTATAKDNENIVVLKSTLKVEDNTFEKYKESIYKAKLEVASLTDYIEILKEEQSKVTGKDELLFISEEKIKAEKERMQLLKEFFIEANVNEQKVIAAQKYYTDLRLELDKQYADKKSQIYVDALAKINKEESDALKDLKLDEFFKKSKGFKELNKVIIGSEYKNVGKQIENLKILLKEFEDNGLKSSETYKEYLLQLQKEQLKLINLQVAGFSDLSSIFSNINQEIGGLIGGIRDFAKGVSNVSAGISNLANNVKTYGADTAGVLTIAKIVVDTINKTGEAFRIKKDAEKAYYDSVQSQQIEYNKLLNDEIRLKNKAASNPYVTNYQGIVEDSIKAQADALDKFNKSLSELENKGKTKDGTKSGVNFFKAIQSVILGPLFKNPADALQTKDVLVSVFEKYPALIDKSKQGVDAFNISLAKSLLASNSLDDATKQMVENTIDWVEQYKAAQEQLQSVILDLTGQIGNDLRNALVTAFKEGTSAADAFGTTVSNVLENIVSQTIFSAVFSKAFEDLKNNFESSFSAEGDQKINDDLIKFYQQYPDLVKVFTDGLSDAKKEAEKAGLDIFKTGTGKTSGGLTGAIKGVTEETAGLLAGQFNAIRITGANHLQVSRDSLLQLTTIANNSRYLQKLESIDNKLGKTSADDLRAGGL